MYGENGEKFSENYVGFLVCYFDEEFGNNWKGKLLQPSLKKKLKFCNLYP